MWEREGEGRGKEREGRGSGGRVERWRKCAWLSKNFYMLALVCICHAPTKWTVKGSSVPARNGLKTLPSGRRRPEHSIFLAGTEDPFTFHATASWEVPTSPTQCALSHALVHICLFSLLHLPCTLMSGLAMFPRAMRLTGWAVACLSPCTERAMFGPPTQSEHHKALTHLQWPACHTNN